MEMAIRDGCEALLVGECEGVWLDVGECEGVWLLVGECEGVWLDVGVLLGVSVDDSRARLRRRARPLTTTQCPWRTTTACP